MAGPCNGGYSFNTGLAHYSSVSSLAFRMKQRVANHRSFGAESGGDRASPSMNQEQT